MKAIAGFIGYFVVMAKYGFAAADILFVSGEFFRYDSPDFFSYVCPVIIDFNP
jgi:hypothetical protein